MGFNARAQGRKGTGFSGKRRQGVFGLCAPILIHFHSVRFGSGGRRMMNGRLVAWIAYPNYTQALHIHCITKEDELCQTAKI